MKMLLSTTVLVCLLITSSCKSKVPSPVVEISEKEELTTSSSTGNTEIHYTVYGKRNHALVFVHGWSCDQSYWSEQVDHFKEKYQVVTIDLGGHGKSGSDRKDWSISSFGNDVLSVVKELDYKKISLVGHSMGVAVVIDAAAKTDIPINQLVGVDYIKDKMASLPETVAEGAVTAFKTDFVKSTQGFVRNSLFLPSSDSTLVSKIADDMSSAPKEIAISAMKDLMLKDLNKDFETLSKKNIDRHLINSDIRPVNNKYLDSIGFNTHQIEKSGHFFMVEKSAEFNLILEGIITSL